MFLRNHDELTLEMVTDEERDYMWRVYATDPTARINLGIRRRLAPLLANSRRKIELLNILLFSMPGTPVLYYGDEIGMGDNFYLGDRNGCRTPMQWSSDRNAGFSKANPQQLYLPITIDPEYHYEAINVENQQKNLSSLLWWTRRVIAMRKNYRAFSRGSIEFLLPENAKVLAFLRRFEDETILVVVNLSRFSQAVELDLSRFAGCAPMEVFSRNVFPAIRKSPYTLTIGPHGHFWFVLQSATGKRPGKKRATPTLEAEPNLSRCSSPMASARGSSAQILPEYLRGLPLVWGKGAGRARDADHRANPDCGRRRTRRSSGSCRSTTLTARRRFTLCRCRSRPAAPRTRFREIRRRPSSRKSARHGAILYDALWDANFREKLFRLMAGAARLKGRKGELVGITEQSSRAGA